MSNKKVFSIAKTEDLFIKKIAPYCQKNFKEYGFPASVAIAQAILETGWGKHLVSNNLFGIKGAGPSGSVRARSLEYTKNGEKKDIVEEFRAYGSIEQSINDHLQLFFKVPAYSKIRALLKRKEKNPQVFAQALRGVYATDPLYSTKLMQIIQEYNLMVFDH